MSVDDVEQTQRPILVRPRAVPGYGHKPVLVKGEVATACGVGGISQMEVRDHFVVRNALRPCRECFAEGYPFSYQSEQFAAYEELAEGEERVYRQVDMPDDLLPNGTVTLGDANE